MKTLILWAHQDSNTLKGTFRPTTFAARLIGVCGPERIRMTQGHPSDLRLLVGTSGFEPETFAM